MSRFSQVDIDVSNNDQRCSTDRDVSCSVYKEHITGCHSYAQSKLGLQLVVIVVILDSVYVRIGGPDTDVTHMVMMFNSSG
jgi:hypothetical protein